MGSIIMGEPPFHGYNWAPLLIVVVRLWTMISDPSTSHNFLVLVSLLLLVEELLVVVVLGIFRYAVALLQLTENLINYIQIFKPF